MHANLHSHPDLFRALKGGSNNFGIVTRFDFKTYKQGELWGGFVVNKFTSSEDSDRQLQFLEAFGTASGAGVNDYAAVENIYSFNASGPVVLANILISTNAEAYPAILREFTSVKPQVANTLRTTSLSNLAIEAGAGIYLPIRFAFL